MKKQTDTQAFKGDDASKQKLENFFKLRDWHSAIFMMPREARFDVLRELWWDVFPFVDNQRWQLFGEVWRDSENIWQNFEGWCELIRSTNDADEYTGAMCEEDADTLDALEFPIVVHRGAMRDMNEHGLSWTTDRKKAEWFARRFTDSDAVLLTSLVTRRDQIVFIDTQSDESEAVIHPDALHEIITRGACHEI